MKAFLGWDAGAWHCDHGDSRDALVLLAAEGGSDLVMVRLGRPRASR